MKARLNRKNNLNDDSLFADAQKMLIENDLFTQSARKVASKDLPALQSDSIL